MIKFQVLKNSKKNLEINFKDKPICIVAPSGPCNDKEKYDKIKNKLNENKIKFVEYFDIEQSNGFLSDTDEKRYKYCIDAINNSKKFSAIIALRGGYGSVRILESVNKYISSKPPECAVIGFSDFTGILSSLSLKYRNTNSNLVHGPGVMTLFDDNIGFNYRFKSFVDVINGINKNIDLLKSFDKKNEILIISKGQCQAKAVGGNLSVFCSLIGTKFQLNCKNRILILEDINETAYKFDRMLMQLKLSGSLKGVKGICIGMLKNCHNSKDKTVIDVLKDHFSISKIPVVAGLPFGHVEWNCCIPIESNDILLKC